MHFVEWGLDSGFNGFYRQYIPLFFKTMISYYINLFTLNIMRCYFFGTNMLGNSNKVLQCSSTLSQLVTLVHERFDLVL